MFTKKLLTVSCMFYALSSACVAEANNEVFEMEQLKKYRTDLFEKYSPTVNLVKWVMGSEYLPAQLDERQGGNTAGEFEWDSASETDLEGGIIASHANDRNKNMRVLWVHPNGEIVVALKRGKNKYKLFTNKGRSPLHLPPAVSDFIHTSSDGSPVIALSPPVHRGKLPPVKNPVSYRRVKKLLVQHPKLDPR